MISSLYILVTCYLLSVAKNLAYRLQNKGQGQGCLKKNIFFKVKDALLKHITNCFAALLLLKKPDHVGAKSYENRKYLYKKRYKFKNNDPFSINCAIKLQLQLKLHK